MTPTVEGLRHHWSLDPDIVFLNHGSFGATPTAVLDHQTALRSQMEAEPVQFFVRDAPDLLHIAIERGAAFVGADPRGFAYVANATTGVNTVLASIQLEPGDELIVTDHEYNACRNALVRTAERTGATIRSVRLPFPVRHPHEIVDAIAAAFTPRTRLLLIDHVTSPTGLVLPIAEIAAACRDAEVEILVDGAHAPGMIDLELDALGVDYYTGNFHKWVCTPKGVAILWIAKQHRHRVRPLVTSHGANMPADEPWEHFRHEFDWVGTTDPTGVFAVPFTIDHIASLVPGGWPEVRRRNHALALTGRALLCEAFHEIELAPASMIGALAAVRIPDGETTSQRSPFDLDPDQDVLLREHRIEVPLVPWPAPPERLVRISAQLYNTHNDMQRLVEALQKVVR